jgi:PAS domain-containing protein
MGKIFAPAAALMNRLGYAQRFGLITFLFVLPLALVIYLFFAELDRQVSFTAKERAGAAYIRPVAQLYELAIKERMINLPAMLGLSFNETDRSNQSNIEVALIDLGKAQAQYGSLLATEPQFKGVETAWRVAKATPSDANRDPKISEFMRSLEALLTHVANSSNIILDPDLDTYYLQDLLLDELPASQNLLTQLTYDAYGALSRRSADAEQKANMAMSSGLIGRSILNTEYDVATSAANNPTGFVGPTVMGPLNEYTKTVQFYLNTINEQIIKEPNPTLLQDTLLAASNDALDASRKLWNAAIDPFDALLQNRIAGFEERRNLSIAVTGSVLFLVVYMWGGFYASVKRTTQSLERASQILESGDTSGGLAMEGRDELSRVAAATFSKIAAQANKMSSTINERTHELTEVAAVLAHHPHGILITDQQGTVKLLNGAASSLLHTRFDLAAGQPLAVVLNDPTMSELVETAVAMPNQHHTVDTMVQGRILEVGATYVPVESGELSGLVTLQDVTELRKLQHLHHLQQQPLATHQPLTTH